MVQKPLEEYLERIRQSDKMYQWPLKDYEKRQPTRLAVHEEFPYVVTWNGPYEFFDDLEDWCREHISDKHGECHWHFCEHSYNKWFDESNLDDVLDKRINDELGPKPNQKKNKKKYDKWFEKYHKIVTNFFDNDVESRIDAPGKHSHWGVWTSIFFLKTGYDYGYCDFCFKNVEDAVYFKIMNSEQAGKVY